jgi:hypothetical protein
MSTEEFSSLGKYMAEDTRYAPAITGLLLTLLALLLIDKLPDPARIYLVPSLIAYTIGASFLGYLQTMFFIRNGRQPISKRKCYFIVVGHIIWIGCFVTYNLCRHVL